MSYKAPVEDIDFVLNEVLELDRAFKETKFNGTVDKEISNSVILEASKLAENSFHPVNALGDSQGCHLNNETGKVNVPDGFKAAYDDYREAGWSSLSAPEAYGGQGLPLVINCALNEVFAAANISLSMYSGLTHGSIVALKEYASDTLKSAYLEKLVTGQYSGTMCLTEAHCGTDLGLIRTKAIPSQNKELGLQMFEVSGSKIWITGGEHDLTDNIVHLVLAKLPDAPNGTKGISMFLVPKFLPDGSKNGVICTGLEHKMGINGSATCFLSFENAKGWLVGEPHQGLKYMFSMMNSARLMVGMQGLGLAEAAYQIALSFAKDRRQGRSVTGAAEPQEQADCIMVHPDVRKMLLQQKVLIEGCRAMSYWVALQEDLAEHAQDAQDREDANDMLALMTPVVKALLTDHGSLCCDLAVQTLGGSGYTKDWAVEQHYRDVRISRIYEGTNGIQSLDLVGRKLARKGGKSIQAFIKMVQSQIDLEQDSLIKEKLTHGVSVLNRALGWLMKAGMADKDQAAASATAFLKLFGTVALAYFWSLSAMTAEKKMAQGEKSPLLTSKLKSAHFFFAHCFPEVDYLIQAVEAGNDTIRVFELDEF